VNTVGNAVTVWHSTVDGAFGADEELVMVVSAE
jgi:hypothetical protein